MDALSKLMRVVRSNQWVKNLIVLGAPIAAGTFTERDTLIRAMISMTLFILASSAVYVFNDLQDRSADQYHPLKSLRPVSSGDVPPQIAGLIGLTCFLASLVGAAFLNLSVMYMLLTYFGVNVAYSIALKHVPYAELCLVASGFTIRAATGGLATDTHISFSYIAVVTLSSLCLISCKRFSECIAYVDHDFRPVLKKYSQRSLFLVISFSIVGSLLTYFIWVVQNQTSNTYSLLSWVMCVVGFLRFSNLAKLGKCENPTLILFTDKLLNISVTCWALTYIGSVYG